MSVVVDSSALIAALIDTGSDGNWAESLIAGEELHAPELVLAEVTNVLRRLELAKTVASGVANAARDELMRLKILLLPFGPFADRVWALRATLTSYDAWYVAIAESSGFPLVTLDRRLARAKGPRCRFLTP